MLKEIQLYLNQIQLMQRQLDLSEKIVENSYKKEELWRAKAYEMTEKYVAAENTSAWKDLFFVGSGVVITAIGAWAVGQVK